MKTNTTSEGLLKPSTLIGFFHEDEEYGCFSNWYPAEFDSDLWNRTCVTIVKRGVRAKFSQNESILQKLINTGNALLAECSPYDKKWGIGIDINDAD